MVILTRPVSQSENFMRSRTASEFYRNFQVIGTYSKEISEDLLFKALRKTLIDYVILACNIFKADDHCYFEPLSKIRYSDVVTVERNRIVDVKFFEEINETVDFKLYCQKPLLKVWLLADNKICSSYEHTIMDGVAGANFHEILLQNFSFIETKPEEYNTKYGSVGVGVLFDYTLDKDKIVYSLPPPIDYFLQDYNLDYSSDPTHFCKAIPEGTTKWPGLHLAKRDYEISYNIINFTPSEVSKILKQCKERKVTLTSYITIMHALTVTPIIGDDHYSVYKIALNLRRHLNPNAIQTEEYKHDLQDKSHFALGCSSHMGYPQNIGPIRKFSWDDVVKVNVNLLETVSNDRALNFSKAFIDTASLHDDNLPYFQSFLGKPRPDTVKVSNIGCVRAKAEKGWEITDMIFAQDMAIIAAEFQFNIVSTPLGGLNFVWCYIKDNGQVCEGYASKLKQNMLSIL